MISCVHVLCGAVCGESTVHTHCTGRACVFGSPQTRETRGPSNADQMSVFFKVSSNHTAREKRARTSTHVHQTHKRALGCALTRARFVHQPPSWHQGTWQGSRTRTPGSRTDSEEIRSKPIVFVHVGGESRRRGRAVPVWGQVQGVRVRVRSRVTFQVGAERLKGHLGQLGQGRLVGVGAPIDRVRREELTADADEGGGLGPEGVGAGASLHRARLHRQRGRRHRAAGRGSAQRVRLRGRPAEAEAACRPFGPTDATGPIACSTCRPPPPRPPRASNVSAAGAPRLQKSCRWRRPQSKGRSCGSGRARRDLRVRGGRGHLSERP